MEAILHFFGGTDSGNSEEEQLTKPEYPINATISQLLLYAAQAINYMASGLDTPIPIDYVLVAKSATWIIGWLTLIVELPMLLLASFALARLVKADNVAPIYIINLLITDLIQLSIRPAFMVFYTKASPIYLSLSREYHNSNSTWDVETERLTPAVVFCFALSAGNGFTLCIALERYLLVAHPLWYRCKHSLQHSLLASVITWATAGLFILLQSQLAQERMVFYTHPEGSAQRVSLFFLPCGNYCPVQTFILLLPLPLLLFFLFGTRRALTGSLSVTTVEQRKILGTLVVVLVNYTVLFLPSVIVLLMTYSEYFIGYGDISWRPDGTVQDILDIVALALIYFSPLLDILLYVFQRRDAKDTLQVMPCLKRLSCYRTRDTQENTTASLSDAITKTIRLPVNDNP